MPGRNEYFKRGITQGNVSYGWVNGTSDDSTRTIALTQGSAPLSFCEDTDYVYGGYLRREVPPAATSVEITIFKIAKANGSVSKAVYSANVASSNLTGSCGRLAIYGNWLYSYWVIGLSGTGLSFGSPFILRHNKSDLSFDTTFKGVPDKGALLAMEGAGTYSMAYHSGLSQLGDYAYGYDTGCRFFKYNMATGALTYQIDMRGTITASPTAQCLVDVAGAYLYAVGTEYNDVEILKANEADGTYAAASRLTMTGKASITATSIIEKPDGNLILAGSSNTVAPVYNGFVAEVTADLATVILCKEDAAGAPANIVFSLGTYGFMLYGYNGSSYLYTVYDWNWNLLFRFTSGLPIPRAVKYDPVTDTLQWLTAGLVLGKTGQNLLLFAQIDKFAAFTGKIQTSDGTVYLEKVTVAEFLTDVAGPGFTTGIGSAASTALSETVSGIETFSTISTMLDYAHETIS